MVEEILPHIYRMEVPLPGNPLKAVNSYVIQTAGRHLVIDTGLNRRECMEVIQQGLKQLDVSLSKTDFFITHLHADHFALVPRLATDRSRVYFNGPDAERHMRGGVWEAMVAYARLHGFPGPQLQEALERHPGYKYGSRLDHPLTIVRDGDTLPAGPYRLKCVETPGHTPGHMCLYDADHKILVSGDHILEDITPNIQSWSDHDHPLRSYLSSLEKVGKLDVDLVLPGHRRIFRDCTRRIGELKRHHQDRALEVISILKEGPQHAFDVASKMTWDIDFGSWDLFPVSQKWFATGEALAHLKYLEEDGKVIREQVEEKVMFLLDGPAGTP